MRANGIARITSDFKINVIKSIKHTCILYFQVLLFPHGPASLVQFSERKKNEKIRKWSVFGKTQSQHILFKINQTVHFQNNKWFQKSKLNKIGTLEKCASSSVMIENHTCQ